MRYAIRIVGNLDQRTVRALQAKMEKQDVNIRVDALDVNANITKYLPPLSERDRGIFRNNPMIHTTLALQARRFEEFWRFGLDCKLTVLRLMAKFQLQLADADPRALLVTDLDPEKLSPRLYMILAENDIISEAMVRALPDEFLLSIDGINLKALAHIHAGIE